VIQLSSTRSVPEIIEGIDQALRDMGCETKVFDQNNKVRMMRMMMMMIVGVVIAVTNHERGHRYPCSFHPRPPSCHSCRHLTLP
jgi:hypothetical protein